MLYLYKILAKGGNDFMLLRVFESVFNLEGKEI